MEVEGKVTPEAMSIILLNEIAGRLSDLDENITCLNNNISLLIPEGRLDDTGTITITDEPKTLLVKSGLGLHWHAVAVINDGTNSCFVAINTARPSSAEKAHEVKPNEEFRVDFRSARIRSVHLFCSSGETTTVRVSGTR